MAGKHANEGQETQQVGRRPKTKAASRARVSDLFSRVKCDERRQQELLSIISELFCRGDTQSEIREVVRDRFPELYGDLLKSENLWDLIREAASRQLFTHTPQADHELTRRLIKDHQWLENHLTVAQTASTEALAQQAAQQLLKMIRDQCQLQRERRRQRPRPRQEDDAVHVGFAGGMTLRLVAEKLASLLSRPHDQNPTTLVFHAMVANFDDDDFYADPNSFITYFTTPECRVNVRLVRLPLPGIIASTPYKQIRALPEIEQVFNRREEIQIVVTSGSLWSDARSTLRTYMRAAIGELQRKTNGTDTHTASTNDSVQEFDDLGVVGDLLWQPINQDGPVRIVAEYEVTTLMGLDELPDFIRNGGSVLLVMGCSGISGMPKSRLLKTILELYERHQWVTHVVTDSPTVEGIYYPAILETLRPSQNPRRPR